MKTLLYVAINRANAGRKAGPEELPPYRLSISVSLYLFKWDEYVPVLTEFPLGHTYFFSFSVTHLRYQHFSFNGLANIGVSPVTTLSSYLRAHCVP